MEDTSIPVIHYIGRDQRYLKPFMDRGLLGDPLVAYGYGPSRKVAKESGLERLRLVTPPGTHALFVIDYKPLHDSSIGYFIRRLPRTFHYKIIAHPYLPDVPIEEHMPGFSVRHSKNDVLIQLSNPYLPDASIEEHMPGFSVRHSKDDVMIRLSRDLNL